MSLFKTFKLLGKPVASKGWHGFATVSDKFVGGLTNQEQDPYNVYLKFKSGQIFSGKSFGADRNVSGEAVFTTSTVGYPESMTDPSFRGQILVFTQPIIGNYGVPGQCKDQFGLLKYFESSSIQVEGIVVTDYAAKYSHWNAVESLGQWCQDQNIPGISNVDTREIVQILRNQGSTLAAIDKDPISSVGMHDPNGKNLVAEVSTKEIYTVGEGDINIGVIDCGIKQNILRALASHGIKLTVLPWDHDFTKSMHHFDGLFISNGPGNPAYCLPLIENLKHAIDHFNKPIFGICMGNQLLGQAAGLSVYKMQFGNRGHNQPALNCHTGRCFITSQNHGYALDDTKMPSGWEKLFINANDGSNEGICHKELPISAVQFHPEAKGGPEDTMFLFKEFIDKVKDQKYSNLLLHHKENLLSAHA